MQGVQGFVLLVARLFIGIPFITFGIYKLSNFEMLSGWMAFKNLPVPEVLLFIAIAFEIIGGLMLITGLKLRLVAVLLILYLIPVHFAMHDYWAVEDPLEKQSQIESFSKGFMIMGGLLFMALTGAGSTSVDALLNRTQDESTGDLKDE